MGMRGVPGRQGGGKGEARARQGLGAGPKTRKALYSQALRYHRPLPAVMLALLWEALEGLVNSLRGDTKNLINSGSKQNPFTNGSFRIQLPRFDTNRASTRKFNKYVGIFDNLDPQRGVAEISLAILSIRMRKTLPGHAPAIAPLALVRTSAKVAETKNLGTLYFEMVAQKFGAQKTQRREPK